jgi:hypothetical protein
MYSFFMRQGGGGAITVYCGCALGLDPVQCGIPATYAGLIHIFIVWGTACWFCYESTAKAPARPNSREPGSQGWRTASQAPGAAPV